LNETEFITLTFENTSQLTHAYRSVLYQAILKWQGSYTCFSLLSLSTFTKKVEWLNTLQCSTDS